MPERPKTQTHPRERDVFLDACDIDDIDARTKFVQDTCGDDDHLRARVEALLQASQNQSVLTQDPWVKDAIDGAKKIFESGQRLKVAPPSDVQRVRSEQGVAIGVTSTPKCIRDYELMECLGQGSMGTVFRARHTLLNTHVAIKLLAPRLSDDEKAVERFRREIEAVGRVQHPNIVRAVDAGETDGEIFLVMELIAGFDFASIVSKKRTLHIPDACEIGCQVATGMHYAHSKGLLHRDLKPANLMLTSDRDGQSCIKILDLGLATIQESKDERRLTDDGTLMGTLGFMSPEQAEDIRSVDSRADIYSLGATLYRLLAGTVPFECSESNSPLKLLRALTTTDLPSIAKKRNDLPTALVQLIDSMLARNPDQRPQQMSEVAAGLAEFSSTHQLKRLLTDREVESGSPTAATVLVDTIPLPDSTFADVSHPTSASVGPQASSSTTGRNRRRVWIMLAGLPLAFLFLGVIWLKSDGGYIRIETSDPSIQVSVEILSHGQLIDTVRVGKGENKLWYRSGGYEVRLPSTENDDLIIIGGSVTLERNGNKLVTIAKVPSRMQFELPVGTNENVDQRAVAEWALERAGTIGTAQGKLVRHATDVPAGSFQISSIEVTNVDDYDVRKILQWLPALPTCHQLALNGGPNHRITDAVISMLSGAHQLKWLSLTSGQITDAGLATLTDLPQLQMLNLAETGVRRQGLDAVQKHVPTLERLYLQSRVMKDEDLEPLTRMANLRHLDLNLSAANAATLAPLSFTNVTELVLRETHTWNSAAAERIAEMPQLNALSLLNSRLFNDTDLQKIVKSKTLRTLRVYRSTSLTASGLVAALEKNPNLVVNIGAPFADSTKFQNHPRVILSPENYPTHSTQSDRSLQTTIPHEPGLEASQPVEMVSGRSTAAQQLPDPSKLPKGTVHVFGTARQSIDVGDAAAIDDFVEVQLHGNIGWYGLRANGDVVRWMDSGRGVSTYRQGLDIATLNRSAGTDDGEWLSREGGIIRRGHPIPFLFAQAPKENVVDLAGLYRADGWSVLTADGRVHVVGKIAHMPPSDITDFAQLGNCETHHFGIRKNGQFIAWGDEPRFGQELSHQRFTKISSSSFTSLLLSTEGRITCLNRQGVVELPEALSSTGWSDICCGNFVFAARDSAGRWHAWSNPGDSQSEAIVKKINSLGPGVSSISMTLHALAWVEVR